MENNGAGRMRACSWMSVAALMAGALTAAPAMAKTVALSHFTLIDGTGRAPVKNAAMIITDGKISWVGPARSSRRRPASRSRT